MNFYNEFDPKAAAWLRQLMRSGEIPEGIIDERSITEIKPDDLNGFAQCHFFAGIGGWPLALKFARWSTKRPVWTASLPCQPFSTAGQSKGVEDERHLWPVFFDLVKVCCPNIVFGEQVARAIGFNWLDGISADLEGAGYAIGQAVLGAHSVGSPHKRQRLYWMGVSDGYGRKSWWPRGKSARYWPTPKPTGRTSDALGVETADGSTAKTGAISGMEHLQEQRRGEIVSDGRPRIGEQSVDGEHQASCRMARTGHGERCAEHGNELQKCDSWPRESGAWSDCDLIYCRDDKFRRVEAGTFPLAARFPRGMVPSGDPGRKEAQESGEA